jgi:amino acid transporter
MDFLAYQTIGELTMIDHSGSDSGRLRELGYSQQLQRGLGIFSTFSIGVATVAPVVGLYAIVGLSMSFSGPTWVWVLLASLVGQLLVAAIYAELASEFPVAGGPYQWTKRLVGPGFGTFTGVVYLTAVSAALATVGYLAAPWFGALLGLQLSSAGNVVLSALLLTVSFIINAAGVRTVKVVVNCGIAAEMIASILIGLSLLLFYRVHPFGILAEPLTASASIPAILATMAVCGWAFVGFDASASVAEETQAAGASVPLAMIAATAIVGMCVVLVAVAVTLATNDLEAVIAGTVADPVTTTVVSALGNWSAEPFNGVVCVTFFACLVSMQAYLGRVVFGLARDNVIPFSASLSKVSARSKVPFRAMLALTVIAAACLLLGLNDGAVGTMITFGTAGLYITFLLVVAAALLARSSGRWKPNGTVRLGRWGMPINILAFVWLLFETINIAWPRVELAPPGAPVLQVWAAVWVFAIVAVIACLMAWYKRDSKVIAE